MLSDRDIVIAHLTLMDALNLEEAESWQNHWEKNLNEMAVDVHSGDCTKEPWTCSRCVADQAYSMVPVYRKLLKL